MKIMILMIKKLNMKRIVLH